ncbi:hypothetical protein [[Phormidium] sp. ETS-05]|uniref:hypothetical protein n=1 Tax=[Phormidium] sp. ETS-05 TaxID=222819 RepID=UPI0018EF2E5E|nr:hypothetical protein [[Phormidium] sp. ETS-05]
MTLLALIPPLLDSHNLAAFSTTETGLLLGNRGENLDLWCLSPFFPGYGADIKPRQEPLSL